MDIVVIWVNREVKHFRKIRKYHLTDLPVRQACTDKNPETVLLSQDGDTVVRPFEKNNDRCRSYAWSSVCSRLAHFGRRHSWPDAVGQSREAILQEYAYLENADIDAVLAFAARQADHPIIAAE
jgi:hypothetical protein